MKMYLEADSILKSYGERHILTDVYLKLGIGDTVAVWGRNGSGKSTLFKILFGAENADRMFLRINGKVIKKHAYSSGLLSYLAQDNFIPANMAVQDLLEHMKPVRIEGKVKDMLDRMKYCYISDLSGGERRLLEVLFVLNNDTPFVILDEPFVGVAPVVCECMCDYIQAVSQDKGILISDHNYRLVDKIANRHFLLEEGCLKPIDSIADLKTHYLV